MLRKHGKTLSNNIALKVMLYSKASERPRPEHFPNDGNTVLQQTPIENKSQQYKTIS